MATLVGGHRRVTGAVLVILALVVVVVVPTINGRRVSGVAVPTTFPPHPQVGDCALPPFPADGATGGFPVEILVTELQFGPCTGAILGEIVRVRDVPAPPPATTGPCSGAAAGYAGLQVNTRSATLAGVPAGGSAQWMPTIGSNTYLVIPGDAERAAGHDWTACLSVPIGNRAYQGTLRNAYTTGAIPDQFGMCWDGVDLDEIPALVRCDEPHAAELLASGWVANRSLVERPDIDAGCLDIAGRIMKTDDPTHGGAITIVLDPVRRDGASTPDAPLTVSCFATASGGGLLTHTVVGLADGPVPLAG